MPYQIKPNDMEFKEIIWQIDYDSSTIKKNLESIKNNKLKMQKWVGKPIYKSVEEYNNKLEIENQEHKKSIIKHAKMLNEL